MPIFDDIVDVSNEAKPIKTMSGFSFSPVNISTLGSSKYTLVGLTVDISGSVSGFDVALRGCVKETIRGCQSSPNADNLLVRTVTFADHVQEVHGFKLLNSCNLDDYDRAIAPGGMTALFDAAVSSVEALSRQGNELVSQDYSANAILVVITDGENNRGSMTATEVARAVQQAKQSENLESIITILVGVGVGNTKLDRYLDQFRTEGKFDQYISIADVTPKSFAKLADFIQKSVSSQSQSIGSGQASQPIVY